MPRRRQPGDPGANQRARRERTLQQLDAHSANVAMSE
jgi:hypothetical protein